MAKATQLLSVLARINPAIFDVIFPHGPVLAHAFASRLSEVALNPQPLPPEPPPERLQRVSALVAPTSHSPRSPQKPPGRMVACA
jgi:hypothetical protein